MPFSNLWFFLCFSLLASFTAMTSPSPYLSPPSIFLPNYQNMLATFKIYIYNRQKAVALKSQAESLFYSMLLHSSFVTPNPDEAHLFFVPFDSDLSTRAVARVIRDLRTELPYWNRTLGADHFYVSCAGIGYESDRNLVELKKNSIQISCFPAPAGKFIPHKDVTLPPLYTSQLAKPNASPTNATKYLGFAKRASLQMPTMVSGLVNDPDFLIESEPSDGDVLEERLGSSKFCVFDYNGDVSTLGGAMGHGCVPAVVADRPIQDLPFLDVLKWREMAVFVGSGGGVEELKRVLGSVSDEVYDRMRSLAASASTHFQWNAQPQPLDSFHTVMYQLWLRRHTIRYGLRNTGAPWKM